MATENELTTASPATAGRDAADTAIGDTVTEGTAIDGTGTVGAGPTSATLLSVAGLTVAYGDQTVVHGVDFALERGQSLALIGESGSGKSTIARAVLRLLPAQARVPGGRIEFAGRDVTTLTERQFRPLRGRQLGFVPQDPASALNAVRTIGSQAQEAAALLPEADAASRRARVLETFDLVGLTDPERVYGSYPHQLSGGMLQRVLIGLAVLPRPALLVADEPTSGLDVTIQKRILDLLSGLKESLGIGLLFITHDLAVAAERADTLVVLKDGKVQERGASGTVFAAPKSPYTRELQADVPAANPDRYRTGPAGEAARPGGGTGTQSTGTQSTGTQIDVRSVSKTYTVGARRITAVEDVSFRVERGRTHALVGESGSGKTTAVRLLLGLEQPDTGEIVVGDESVRGRSRGQWRSLRRHLQLVYQNPFTSLDPTWRVERVVREPLDRFGVGDKAERRDRVREAFESVGLPASVLSRRPTHLSGGQRQRVAIARALVLRPDVVVLDEPTSALDVTVQAGIIDLLFRLQSELGLTYLFVSHDLSLVRQIADTVSVLQRGRVVEDGPVREIFAQPRHPYTRALLDAIPALSSR
jgi:peptide/nickel transport system ATP-binding protein